MAMAAPGAAPAPESRPLPAPRRGEAVVEVRASTLNYHDLVNLLGLIDGPWPRVPLTDGCGVVVAVGEDVRGVAVGDRVIGAFHPLWLDGRLTKENRRVIPGDTEDGWLQRYKAFPAAALVAAPPNCSDVQAASLVCAGATAWAALEAGQVTSGDTVVTLGTGGVSLFAAQLAKARGARVVLTSSSDEKLARAAPLGVDATINYRTAPDWDREVLELTDGSGADLVVDLGGPDTMQRSIAATRIDGTVAVTGVLSGFGPAEVPVTETMTKQIRLRGINTASARELRRLVAAVTANQIEPVVSHRFDWRDLAEGQRVQHACEHFGKIGITIPGGDP